MKLRDYQQDACDAITAAWEDHQSVMAVLPTGTGKTEIFVHLAGNWEQGRVLIVAPLIQLVSQAVKKVTKRTGIAPGIEQASQTSCELEYMRSPFVVGSKQTLTGASKRYKKLVNIGLVIIDECHLATTDLYKEMLDYFRDRGAKVLGLTATPNRHDGIGMDNIFDHCAINMGISDGVDQGWLVRAKAKCVQLESLDLSLVSTKGSKGDFKDGELANVMERDEVVFEIADVAARESENLKTVIFCACVNEAQAVAERLVDRYGKRADWICGDKIRCPDEKRQEVLDSFTEDPEGLQFVCNVGILCLGWDFPGLEHIVMARPTKSLGLFTQIFGRGTRPLDGVVDFEGSTAESRLAAIEASDKTHFRITDLVDSSMQHKICTSADVLAGNEGVAITARARKLMQQAGSAIDVEGALTEAELQLKIEEKQRKKREEEERQRRLRDSVEAQARYRSFSVNPFDTNHVSDGVASKKGPRMTFGKHKGKLLRDIPTSYLDWLMREANISQPWLRNSIAKEHRERVQPMRTSL